MFTSIIDRGISLYPDEVMEDVHVREPADMVGAGRVFEGRRKVVQVRVVGGHQRITQGNVAEFVGQQRRGEVVLGGFLDQFDGGSVGHTEIQMDTCFKILMQEVVT